jgi:hypothetical protein
VLTLCTASHVIMLLNCKFNVSWSHTCVCWSHHVCVCLRQQITINSSIEETSTADGNSAAEPRLAPSNEMESEGKAQGKAQPWRKYDTYHHMPVDKKQGDRATVLRLR